MANEEPVTASEQSPTLLQEKRAGIGLTLGPKPKPKSQAAGPPAESAE